MEESNTELLNIEYGEEGKEDKPCETVEHSLTLGAGASAIAALAALGVSAYDSEGNEKDVGTLMGDIKEAVQLNK